MKHIFTFFGFLLLASGLSSAQSNEVSLSAGATFTTDQNLVTTLTSQTPCTPTTCFNTTSTMKPSAAFTFEASYARRLIGAGPADIYVELPVMATPGHNVGTTFNSTLGFSASGSTSSSLFFLTPSVRVSFLRSAGISPWVTVGGGWARLEQSGQNFNKAALQFGGGVDFKSILPHVILRAEARDFYAGGALQTGPVAVGLGPTPVVLTNTISPLHQHHVFAGAGIVLRF